MIEDEMVGWHHRHNGHVPYHVARTSYQFESVVPVLFFFPHQVFLLLLFLSL